MLISLHPIGKSIPSCFGSKLSSSGNNDALTSGNNDDTIKRINTNIEDFVIPLIIATKWQL